MATKAWKSKMAILPTALPGSPASPVRAPSRSPGRTLSLRPPAMHRVLIGGSNGSGLAFNWPRAYQASGCFCRSSMACARLASAGATSDRARPFAGATAASDAMDVDLRVACRRR